MHEPAGDEQLYEVARIKRSAEERIMRRADFGASMAAKLWSVLVLLIVAVAWIVRMQAQVNENTKHVRTLYLQVFKIEP